MKQHVKIVPIPGAPTLPLAKPSKSIKSKKNTSAGESKNTTATDTGLMREVDQISKGPTASQTLKQISQEAAQKGKNSRHEKRAREAMPDGLNVESTTRSASTKAEIERENCSAISKPPDLEIGGFGPPETGSEKKDKKVNEKMKITEEKSLHETEHIQESVDKAAELNNDKKTNSATVPGHTLPSGRNSVKESPKRPAAILPPDAMYNTIFARTIQSTPTQSQNSTAWKSNTPTLTSRMYSVDRLESIQSPNSTAWKPASLDQALKEVILADSFRDLGLSSGGNKRINQR